MESPVEPMPMVPALVTAFKGFPLGWV